MSDLSRTDYFESLFGNEQLKSYLLSGIGSSKLPHALIFDGAEGSGKKIAAKLTAAALAPEFADKIIRMMSPDVTLHMPEDGKKSIGVALIRSIREAAYITPQELSVRVFIIAQAESMTVEAQNALLKILEEPPGGVYFFLLCDNASALLATVRSRAPVLRMQLFSESQLSDYIISHDEKARKLAEREPETFNSLIHASEGTIGGVLKRFAGAAPDGQKLRKKTDELLRLLSEGKKSEITLFFLTAGFARDELDELMFLLSLAVRDMLTVKYGIETSYMYFLHDESGDSGAHITAADCSSQFARDTLMKIYACADRMREYLLVNVNPQLFSLRCADMLSEALK